MLVVTASCDSDPRLAQSAHEAQEAIDVVALESAGHPAARDLLGVVQARTTQLSRCADRVRAIVRLRRNEIGFGRVGVTVDAVARRGHALALHVVAVEPVFPAGSGFATCVASALDGESAVASASYTLPVRLHLCVQPEPVSAGPGGS
jgi:hypothetical protein